MEGGGTPPHVIDQWDARNSETHTRPPGTQSNGSGVVQWTNGRCIQAVPSSSLLSPSFDLSQCRDLLEREGLQVPTEDFETPLQLALDSASVRRYLFFNSAMFHFLMAPINVNVDVRLVQVNERLFRHNLLVGVADWVHQCSGTLQLFCVYWDLTLCQRSLTDALEEMSFTTDETQSKLQKNMSCLNLVTEVTTFDPGEGSVGQEGSEEETPLLVDNESRGCSTPASQRGETKLTKDYSLVPGPHLSVQATAHQLLLTYSATYVRLLVSEKLPCAPQRPLHTGMSHCTIAPICLCQYVQRTVLT